MTKLPAKNLLDGSKLPKTTTGEMKDALGKLRDYLNELLGEDSADKEAARLALGIDLAKLETRTQELEEEIIKRGVPVGSIDWLAVATPPAGYLKADGSAVGRETYPDLFAAIGITFGEGDGETTFNLPNLMGRFAQGSATPGTVKEAGLPNVTGQVKLASGDSPNMMGLVRNTFSEALYSDETYGTATYWPASGNPGVLSGLKTTIKVDASRSNPIYGASDTVQPAALTLLPCIKAFDAAVNPGLIDVTELANSIKGYLPLSGGVMRGHITRPDNTGDFILSGGTSVLYSQRTGARLVLKGSAQSEWPGAFQLCAIGASGGFEIVGHPTGELTWGGKSIVREEARGDGYIRYSEGIQFCWGSITPNKSVPAQAYNTASVTWPLAFRYSPFCWTNPFHDRFNTGFNAKSVTNGTLYYVNDSNGTFTISKIDWFAIGFWK